MTVDKADPRDPSAAKALEDDVDDWISMDPQDGGDMPPSTREATATATKPAQNDATEEVNQDIVDVLQAVDDLLRVTEDHKAESSSAGASNAGRATVPRLEEKRAGESESPLKIRQRLRAAQQKLKRSVAGPVARFSVNTTRRMVTGSPETRVRDFVVLPHVVRVLDKYMFTFGILGMLLTQYIILQHPRRFRHYFVVVMLPLLILRVVLFQRTKQQFFLLDYCYWVNGLGFFCALCPKSLILPAEWHDILWKIFFVSSNGPLFFAMVAWNNSLVFHSIDKSTSTAVHMLPALLSLCERWRSTEAMNDHDGWLPISHHLVYPLAFYATWQTVYLWLTESLLKNHLDADPELSTSLRYLTTAEKMSIHRQTLKLCRACRIMGRNETFSPPTFKVKTIFVALQALMTVCTFLPVTLFYRYEWIHYPVVLSIFTFSVYNGARYYVQVFSRIYEKRYQQQHEGGKAEEDYVDTSAVMTEHVKEKMK